MKTYDDIKLENNRRILLWGPSGNGKTSLAGQWPGILLADTDGEGHQVWKSPWFLGWNGGPPDLVGWDSFDDERDKYGLYKDAKAIWAWIDFINKHADDEGVRTIEVDSLTTVQDLCMHVGYEISARDKKSRTYEKVKQKSGSTSVLKPGVGVKALEHPVMAPTQADFGSEMAVFQQILDGLLSIRGKDIICIAHERLDYADNGALRGKGPLLTGSAIRARIGKWFSEVWYLDVNNAGKRVLITQPEGLIQNVKTRSGLPARIEDPTYTKIMELCR